MLGLAPFSNSSFTSFGRFPSIARFKGQVCFFAVRSFKSSLSKPHLNTYWMNVYVSSDLAVMWFNANSTILSLFEVKAFMRSEEHTSELQSRENLVCRLLLEKKKKKTI